MPASPIRYRRLLQEIPKHKTAQAALEASGFTHKTATKQAKSVLRSAVKHHARELLELTKASPETSKQLMSEIVGITRSDLFATLKKIALQDKDYGSALKVLAPLSKEHGVILSADEDQKKVTVPILNIVVDKTEAENMAKNIEPVSDDETLESQELENGSTKP